MGGSITQIGTVFASNWHDELKLSVKLYRIYYQCYYELLWEVQLHEMAQYFRR